MSAYTVTSSLWEFLLHCVLVCCDTCGASAFTISGSLPILILVNHKFSIQTAWHQCDITICKYLPCRTISTASKKVQVLWERVHPTSYWTVRECLPLSGVATMVFIYLWQLSWPSNTGTCNHAIWFIHVDVTIKTIGNHRYISMPSSSVFATWPQYLQWKCMEPLVHLWQATLCFSPHALLEQAFLLLHTSYIATYWELAKWLRHNRHTQLS